MPSIEFVDDGDPEDGRIDDPDAPNPAVHDPAPGVPAAAPTGAPSSRVGVATGVLLLAAAGLLAAAPFADVYRLHYGAPDGNPADVQDERVDGWGRVTFRVRSGIEGHATRLGIGLYAVAGVLVVVAVAALLPRVHGPWHARARRWSPGAVLVCLGAGVGVLGAAALELQSTVDNTDTFQDGDLRVRVGIGGFFWLGSAALVLIALGAAAPLAARALAATARSGDRRSDAPQAESGHG